MREAFYDCRGMRRKRLCMLIEEYTGSSMHYMGAPRFQYEIGRYVVTKNGTLCAKDTDIPQELLKKLEKAGFKCDRTIKHNIPTQIPMQQKPSLPTIEIPRTGIDEQKIIILKSLINSRATLICHSLNIDNLSIEVTPTTIKFQWFREEPSEAARLFIQKLCNTAFSMTRRPNPIDTIPPNEKYAFRCFLLKLGFIGDEYKTMRKELLQNLSGDSAWKDK